MAKTEKAKMGRPRIQIDDKKFRELLQLRPKLEWIAAYYECNPDTIRLYCTQKHGLTFSQLRDKMSFGVRMSLLQKAISEAHRGNSALLIFSLKNMCGWSDEPSNFDEDGDHELVFD